MSTSLSTQFKNSSNILITFGNAQQQPDGDAIASALSLKLELEKQSKKVSIVSRLPLGKFSFLEQSNTISQELTQSKKFIISLDVSQNKVEEFSYEVENNKLNIYLTPQKGQFKPTDVSTTSGNYQYDLIVLINTPQLSDLGKLYQDNITFFYETTKINLDHQANNTGYGEVQLIKPTASSSAEILYNHYFKPESKELTATQATQLLTGIIDNTNSFQKPNVTPQTLEAAGNLINAKADRTQIVNNLFYNKEVGLMQLLGRTMARIETNPQHHLFSTSITLNDWQTTGINPQKTPQIINEIINTLPQANIILILVEQTDKQQTAFIYTLNDNFNLKKVFADYDPAGKTNHITFKTKGTLNHNKSKLTQKISEHLEINIATARTI